MGNMQSAKIIIEKAKLFYEDNEEEFKTFVNIKTSMSLGGNNALLYACESAKGNYILVQYLIDVAGADPNVMNDKCRNALILAAIQN
jgi:ankyrin repeat protein